MVERARHLRALHVPGWETVPNLAHGFLGRPGGVSRGVFAELNLSDRVGDADEAVRENWRRVTAAMNGMHAARMRQVHGSRIVTVVSDAEANVGEADAMVTRSAAAAVGVLTADCVPILMLAAREHVIAAVHAGWRGTVAGIAHDTVRHIERDYGARPADIHVALGPAIGGCCYEVDGGIADALEERWGPMSAAIRRDRGTKAMVDLRLANAGILASAGIRLSHITRVGPCTRCAPSEYFSHRGACGPTGRQWSFIGWRP